MRHPYRAHRPHPISLEEWNELARFPEFQESCGVDMYPKSDQGAYLRGLAFGARFDFIDPAPGYSGPLYVIAAGATTDPPLVFVRDARGELVPASDGPDAAAE